MASGVTPARRAALRLLQSTDRGRRLDVGWAEEAPRLDPGDRGWVQEAAFGTIRLRGRIDHLLDLHLDRGIGSVPPSILPVLRLGAYQLLCMDGVPAYAAVSQAVDQARGIGGPRAGGLVNAVLRALQRAGGGPERFPTDPLERLSTWGSHPRWLLDRWIHRYGTDDAARLVEAGNRVPPLYVRPFGRAPRDAVERLGRAGIEAGEGPAGSGTVRLESGASPAEALEAVPGVVQDPAAAWVVEWVGPVAGRRVVDLCAAPGGKALGLAAKGGRVVAADRSAERLMRLGAAADRLGLRVPRAVADAGTPPLAGTADVVLVDAPCSGTGTLARHPDARWRLSEADIATLAGVQERILGGAAGVVAPGGLLVYATCTLEPEENERRVEAFLRRHPGFILEGGAGVPDEVVDGPFLRVLPQRTGTDGSFAARLRRDESRASRRTEE